MVAMVALMNCVIVSEFADGCNGSCDELHHCVGVW